MTRPLSAADATMADLFSGLPIRRFAGPARHATPAFRSSG